MEKKVYEQLNETLYKEVLPNGLRVFVLPKPGFHKTYGLFSTNYGSIDNEFGYAGEEMTRVPDGIAHFLEHKLFEKEDGDVFQLFGKQGASSNAFTSFTKTSYLFSATDHVKENLLTLIDFVQDPYFTKETVEKEKGIIGQEIQMYDDDPIWRQFFGILKNLYPKHPLHIDIAGTIESIAEITAEDLYHCYHTFYHPSNMTLFVVGNVDPEEILAMVRDNQASKTFAEIREIKRHFPEETAADIVPFSTAQMPVNRTKVVIGIKGFQADLPQESYELLRFRTALNLLFQLLIGNTSKNYLRLYNEGVIDDTFGFEFSLDRSFHFADFSGDSDNPDAFSAAIEELLLGFAKDPEVNEANLVLLKKKMLGKYFQSLNSLEFIANQFTQDLFGDVTLFDVPEVIQSIQLTDVLNAGHQFIQKEAFSRFYLSPLEK
ncbi:EF-P 5-aminopentanol modification-associated protein YfmH [Enterococcus saccharolyticus]|uniref:EF-P 5-aminopentanol modification-associated protein YfmH n=1 Tax=Enterococcus saccharolyticus TaxID=41997 RepID=UPI0039E186D2